MEDCAKRIRNRVQITTDGHKVYLDAVENAFGADIDYAQLQKRLTNGFSKKVENHRHMIALFFLYYNFCRIHSTLRVTPAMEAGISDHVWNLEEMCALLPKLSASTSHIDKKLVLKALGD
jgi:hypothetical protein